MAYEDFNFEEDVSSQETPGENHFVATLLATLRDKYGLGYERVPEDATLEQLLTHLQTSNWQDRVVTARFLGEIGGPEVIASLSERLGNDEFSSVRAAAVRALGELHAQAAEPLFVTALEQDIDNDVRTAAAQALGKLGSLLSPTAVDALVESSYAELDETTRAATLSALGTLGERTPIAVLKLALDDPNWIVREAAALALGKQGTRADEAALEALLNDEAEPVCKAAVYALGKIGEDTDLYLFETLSKRAVNDDSGKKGPQAGGQATSADAEVAVERDSTQKKTDDLQVRKCTHQDVEFYAYESGELSGTKVVAQALDNQWLPQSLIRSILKGKLSTRDAEKYLGRLVRTEYIRSLINSDRVIINRAYLYNNSVIFGDYLQDGPSRKAFKKLLEQGVIVPWLLYELSPDQKPDYSVLPQSFPLWQQLCKEVAMHCVRFSWDEQTHSQLQLEFTRDFQELVQNLYDKNPRKLLLDLNLPPSAEKALFRRLDELHELSYDHYRKHRDELRPHITRNILYEQFVTKGNTAERTYDSSKPFAGEIKQLLDLIYNAHQADVFDGYLLTPIDSPNRHILQEWSPQRYHSARKFDADSLINMLRGSAFSLVQEGMYLRSMGLLTLQDILDIRSTEAWLKYIKSLEALLKDPIAFSTLAESVYYNYVALAQEMTQLIELRQRSKSEILTALWEPSVKMKIEVGAASQEVIWNRDGTFHPKPDLDESSSIVLGRSDGSAPVTVRWTIGDSGATSTSTQAKLFSSIDILQGRMPNAQREWQKLLRQLGDALKSREFSARQEPKIEVPTVNDRV